jgi:hypothetical protein
VIPFKGFWPLVKTATEQRGVTIPYNPKTEQKITKILIQHRELERETMDPLLKALPKEIRTATLEPAGNANLKK